MAPAESPTTSLCLWRTVCGESMDLRAIPLHHVKLSSMSAAEKISLKKQLMEELALVRTLMENITGSLSRNIELPKRASLNACSTEQHQVSASRKRKPVETNLSNGCGISDTNAAPSKKKSVVHPPERLEIQMKRWEMDCRRSRLCASILQKLMTHRFGWVFNHPVNPLKLNIPEYYSVVSEPMDLGSIKTKLEGKQYKSTHQFAADVKLTFANAMKFNPSCTQVHAMAKYLDRNFSSSWQMAELKWKTEESGVLAQHQVKEMHREIVCTLPVVQKETSLMPTSHSKKYLSPAEKLMLKKDIEKFPLCKMSSKLLNFLRKNSLLRWIKDKVSIDIDKADGDTLWQLHEIMDASIDARTLKRIDKETASPKHVIQKETPSSPHCVGQMTMAEKFRLKKCIKEAPSQRKPHKLLGSFKKSSRLGVNKDKVCMKVDARHIKPVRGINEEANCITQHLDKGDGKSTAKCEYAIDKLQPGPLPPSKDLSYNKDCSHDSHNDFTLPKLSNVESERSYCVENLVQNTKISEINSGEDDFNLNVVVHRDRRSSESDGEKDAQLCGEQLSPSKALRIARLKSRYVDTILKAQHKCEKVDQKRMQQEREILASKFQQEKERIEAQVKVAKAAAEKQMCERKMKIEQEREAARLALKEIEDSIVIFNDFNKTLEEMEELCHSKVNPLRQLGLFLKDDELSDEDGWEEGEIRP